MGIQSIERASAILRALASGPRRLGVSDLSDRLGLAKGTTHGLLRTLQAEGLVELLKDANLEVVLSSPYLRCIETVDPVARHFGLQVAQERSLAEGQTGDSIVQLVRRFAGRNVVLCTHGDVLEDLLEHLIRDGLVARAGAKLEKGSIWALDESAGRLVKARYIPAP